MNLAVWLQLNFTSKAIRTLKIMSVDWPSGEGDGVDDGGGWQMDIIASCVCNEEKQHHWHSLASLSHVSQAATSYVRKTIMCYS